MLFDTDVLIWAFRGSSEAQNEIDNDEDRNISIVTYMELLQGARNRLESLYIKQFLEELKFKVIPVTDRISYMASAYVEEFALKSGLGVCDALIFATANVSSLCLCSGNKKHYSVINSLVTKDFSPLHKR